MGRLYWLAVLCVLAGCGESKEEVPCDLTHALYRSGVSDDTPTCELQPEGTNQLCRATLRVAGAFGVELATTECAEVGTTQEGDTCAVDQGCVPPLVCIHGACTELCTGENPSCMRSGTTVCVFPGWISSGGAVELGYCAEQSFCGPPDGQECPAGRECRPLFSDQGIPTANGDYRSSCTPPLGSEPENAACSFSDECQPGLACAAIPGVAGSTQVCRMICSDSAACAASAVGTWCSTDVTLDGSRFWFNIDGNHLWGVCMSD